MLEDRIVFVTDSVIRQDTVCDCWCCKTVFVTDTSDSVVRQDNTCDSVLCHGETSHGTL